MAATTKPKSTPQPAAPKKKPKKSAKAKIKKKPRKLRLKGWLKTPEDWAKFNAWAAVKALPRKQLAPEPIIRPSKPLPRLKKRIAVLSKPSPPHGEPQPCVIRGVSKAALRARASPRTKKLARPNWKDDPDDCREWTVSRAALLYEPSEAILKISRPVLRDEPEDCRSAYTVSRGALKRKTTEKDEELARPKRVREADQAGEEKKKEEEELSPWVDFLALPAYRVLKDQESEQAIQWKARILDEIEVRGKQALEEQRKKREEDKQQRKQKIQEQKAKKELEAQRSKSTIGGEEQNVEQEETEGKEEQEELLREEEEVQNVEEDAKSKQQVQFGEDKVQEDEETKRKRRMDKEPWRYTDSTCKEFPLKIPKSALNYEATEKIIAMSQPKKRKAEDCIEDPFKVKESAKSASASPKIEELAKPKYPVEPKERPPPREKDEFGRPIFPQPIYGKVLPKVKPYQMGECKDDKKDEESDETEDGVKGVEKEKKDNKEEQEKQKKSIDPIAYAPTIDPIFDPTGAAKQARERKRLVEQSAENKENKTEESAQDEEEEVVDASDVVADENVDDTGNEDENENEEE